MTLFSIFKRFPWRISLTMVLVLAEAALMLLLPLVIGFAIDGLIQKSYQGVWQLAGVGFGVLIIGMLRRVYDTRVYAGIYVDLAADVAGHNSRASTSALSARVSMLKELVEFFENSFPELINNLIGLVGTVVILYALDREIFWGCLAVLVLIVLVFVLTGERTTALNREYNNALEEQVSALESRASQPFGGYMRRLMHWNIKLSDLETLIFGAIWFAMIGLIVFSVVQAAGDGSLQYGVMMSVVMYVFQFADDTGMLPLYYQQFLRLKEISARLKGAGLEASEP